MTHIELKELVESIDPKNTEYILANGAVQRAFDWFNREITLVTPIEDPEERKKRIEEIRSRRYNDLVEKIKQFDSIYLTPANAKVGDGATVNLYTDRHAGTIVKVTKSTITIRRDKATRSPDFKPEWIVGGFAAHCTNQDEQEWTYEPDENGALTTLHWSKKYNRYGQPGDLTASNGRHEFYDYNF